MRATSAILAALIIAAAYVVMALARGLDAITGRIRR